MSSDNSSSDEEDDEKPKEDDADAEEGIRYENVDVQQVVKILDVACQAGIPLDSRLLLLAVQRDWAHVILVLCSKQGKRRPVNVDVQGKDGLSPLMFAARQGKKACLRAMLQSGACFDLDKVDS